MSGAMLDRNLLSLGASDPPLASRIGRTAADPRVLFRTSRTGCPVASVEGPSGPRALHSLFDPEKEGRRYLDAHPSDGFFIFLGFGCGYHILPFLEMPDVTGIVIVEKNAGFFKSVLGEVDLRLLFLDPRVRVLVDPAPGDLRDFILSSYFPAVSGDLHTVNLRARIDTEEEFFRSCVRVVKESLDALSDDFTVQAKFGKKWFLNTLANLAAAEKSVVVPPPKRLAVVTGAGPSLEDGIPRVRELRSESLLIATDTSLPVLRENRITPDLVISIDCQHISYNHFLQGFPEEVPLVLDLASPPVLTKIARKTAFFTSGHPFSQYVNKHWRRFPAVDTSGGNVSHAAVSLADRLGAAKILLFGADFSFPEGKSYARGSYVYPYFRGRESRFAGLESLFMDFLFRGPAAAMERHGGVYTTRSMLRYRERLEEASGGLAAELVPVPGRGLPLRLVPRERTRRTSPPIFAPGPGRGSWKSFLASYGEAVAALPEPRTPLLHFFSAVSREERDLWMTLFPAAASFVRAAGASRSAASSTLEAARRWTGAAVEKFLLRG